MKSTKHLRLRLRLIEGALLLLLGMLTMAAVSTRQLLLDAANHPTTNVDFTDSHWTGTLDAARLPATLPLLDSHGGLTLWGTLTAEGGLYVAPDIQVADAGGALYATAIISASGAFFTDGIEVYSPQNGQVIADPSYLYTVGQSYQSGTVTPTGYLTIKDASGTVYRIPAVADGP